MRKFLAVLFLLTFALSQGCSPARKPAPAPEPKPLVVPETSKVGFSPVDLNRAPDVVKDIAADLAKREAATWLQVNGASYVLVSAGEKAAGIKVEITDVLQRVPAQNFIWIDVKARYVTPKEGEKPGPVAAVTLNLTDRTINGVSFEVARTTAVPPPAQAPAPAPTAPAPPAAKPVPAPSTQQTPAPAPAPAPETPVKKPPADQQKSR
ncbi:MAG: hypothetical protein ACYC0Q_03005 [Eubacteriales bacterium]